MEDVIAPFLSAFTGHRILTETAFDQARNTNVAISSQCERRLSKLLHIHEDTNDKDTDDPFQDVSLVIHRNGDAKPCGQSMSSILQQMETVYATMQGVCPTVLDKYQVESMLTRVIHQLVDTCPSVEKDGTKKMGFLGFCDMGPSKTPILLDHADLVPVVSAGNRTSLPCRFHTREGLRITKLSQLSQMARSAAPGQCEEQSKQQSQPQSQSQTEGEEHTQTCNSVPGKREIHLYAVPAGRVFMFAPAHVGEIFELPHVTGADNKTIYLEVISLSPRVFDVFHFFSRSESKELVDRALAEKSESHRIKRSSTGASGYNINPRRTSESGFDTHGKTSTKVKQ